MSDQNNNGFEFVYDPDTDGIMLVKCISDSETVVIPQEYDGKPVTVIGPYCFIDVIDKSMVSKEIFVPECDNTSLKKLILPDSLLEIRYCAFMHCTSLKEIIIPENVQYIGPSAFLNCYSLSGIKFPERCRMVLRGVCRNCRSLEKADISGAYEIEYGAFMGCSMLNEVKIGNRLIKIGAMSFMDCTSLSSITLPDSLVEIEKKAFWDTSISDLYVPSGVYRQDDNIIRRTEVINEQ